MSRFLDFTTRSRTSPRLESWVPNLQQLEGESSSIVLVDNASTDSTPDFMSQMAIFEEISLECRYRHQSSVSGWMGFVATQPRPLDDFSWVTTFHQDDIYMTSHPEGPF